MTLSTNNVFNSPCTCNYGFTPNITNISGTLNATCVCPEGFTNNGGKACCPPNSSFVAATNTCSCNTNYLVAGINL